MQQIFGPFSVHCVLYMLVVAVVVALVSSSIPVFVSGLL